MKKQNSYLEKLDNLDISTKIRYIQLLLIQNGDNIAISKRFQKRKGLKRLFSERKKLRMFRGIYLQDALKEQYYLINYKLLKDKKQRYRYDCSFKISSKDICKIKGYALLLKLGVYSKDNLVGVVKDHRYSVIDGFNNKVATEMLAHSANCEFLTYDDNSKKSGNSSVSIEQLQEEISSWN